MNALGPLKKHTTVLADTGDFEAMKAYKGHLGLALHRRVDLSQRIMGAPAAGSSQLRADAGGMMTASPTPAHDNGYKVNFTDGAGFPQPLTPTSL